MAHILSMLSGREALWQQRRDRAHARQFLRVTHNFFAVNTSRTLPGSPIYTFGAYRAPGGAGEEENEFLWNCDIPGRGGKGLITSVTINQNHSTRIIQNVILQPKGRAVTPISL